MVSGVTKTSARHVKSLGFGCIHKRKRQAKACTLSEILPLYLHSDTLLLCPSVPTHTHTNMHARTHACMQWPGGLHWALWMKKRSHLSDSSLSHLVAPFKNTLYSSQRLKLHFTDSMMESPILLPLLPLSFFLPLSAISGASSSVFPSKLPTSLAKPNWVRLNFGDGMIRC